MDLSPLAEGFALAHQRFRTILTDLLWKSIWLVFIGALLLVAGAWLASDIGSLEWQGPELTAANPILLITVVRELWTVVSGVLFWVFLAVAMAGIVLWLVLEAYFRGGPGNFWIFLASRVARLTILGAAAFLLGLLVVSDDTGGTTLVALAIILGLWFVVTVVETLVRKDAVELFATDLFLVAASLGILQTIELLADITAVVVSAALVLHASQFSEFVVTMGFSVAALVLATALNSYLFVVRFSTVEIMRRNVVDV